MFSDFIQIDEFTGAPATPLGTPVEPSYSGCTSDQAETLAARWAAVPDNDVPDRIGTPLNVASTGLLYQYGDYWRNLLDETDIVCAGSCGKFAYMFGGEANSGTYRMYVCNEFYGKPSRIQSSILAHEVAHIVDYSTNGEIAGSAIQTRWGGNLTEYNASYLQAYWLGFEDCYCEIFGTCYALSLGTTDEAARVVEMILYIIFAFGTCHGVDALSMFVVQLFLAIGLPWVALEEVESMLEGDFQDLFQLVLEALTGVTI